MAFFNAGQYVDAVTAFSDFVANFPQDRRREEAIYRLAESYRLLGHNDDAMAAYTYQVKQYPEGPLRINGELWRGVILFGASDYADAIPSLQLVAEKGDGELQQTAKYVLGRSLLATQKEADGRTMLQSVVDQQPPGKFAAGAAQTLAELDDSENKFADALPLWQKALALSTDPTDKATSAARGGWSALEAKKPDDAEKLFQAARQNDPSGDSRKVAKHRPAPHFLPGKTLQRLARALRGGKRTSCSTAPSRRFSTISVIPISRRSIGMKQSPALTSISPLSTRRMLLSPPPTSASSPSSQIDQNKTLSEAAAYLKAWPKSPYEARVRLLEAQELSRQKNFAAALPLWESLANEKGDASWPHQEILLERARAYDELGDFPKAATSYQAYLDDLNAHPSSDKDEQARNVLRTQARLAVCLQKSNQLLAATDAWKAVQSLAPEGSREQEAALEALGLIYARGGPSQAAAMVTTFRALLDKFTQSPLRPMAAFSVGDSLFKNQDYAGADRYLLIARDGDAKTWLQPATQRLVLGAYGQKDYAQTVEYLKQYDAIPLPADPQAQLAARLPAALFYWLAETARNAGKWDEAETYYTRVTQHPDPGDLLAGAWWQLGQVQGQRKEWAAAVASYEKYRQLKPGAKDATIVILADGRAQLGAQNFDAAKKLGEQALVQEPEGPNSASARMLLGEVAFAMQNYPEAARMFGTLAVLFDDPKITPQAMLRAADSFQKAGDAKSAADWQKKLKDKYPQYQPSSYL